jgi:hypothetical protein
MKYKTICQYAYMTGRWQVAGTTHRWQTLIIRILFLRRGTALCFIQRALRP